MSAPATTEVKVRHRRSNECNWLPAFLTMKRPMKSFAILVAPAVCTTLLLMSRLAETPNCSLAGGCVYTVHANHSAETSEHASHERVTTVQRAKQINRTAVRLQQEERQARIAQACSQDPMWPLHRSWPYKADVRSGLIYCPIPKAGWSSWKRLFFYLNGVINTTEADIGITPDHVAGVTDLYISQIERLLAQGQTAKTKFLFVFVRNPWSRLISAYINKAVDWNYTRILHTPCFWETMTPYKPPISFAEFLRCITDHTGYRGMMDMHWSPMSRLCDFCRIRYDHIGHLETVDEDSQYILNSNGITVNLPHVFASKAHREADVARDWYRTVPIEVIEKLRSLYRFDFLLHGYSDFPPGWEARL